MIIFHVMSAVAETRAIRVQQWVEKQRELLELEREAEIEESAQYRASNSEKLLEEKGQCFRHLYIHETRTGIVLINLYLSPHI
jgi:hypothetical protein